MFVDISKLCSRFCFKWNLVPLFPSPVIPVNPGPVPLWPPSLWGALSSWQPCGSIWLSLGTLGCLFLLGAAEGKDTRLSLKWGKKKNLTELKASCSDPEVMLNWKMLKDAWEDDKVLTCLYSLIHFIFNCAAFCVTNLLLSRVCKDRKNADFLSISL